MGDDGDAGRHLWEASPSPKEEWDDEDIDWEFEVVGEEVGFRGKMKYEVAWDAWARADGTNTTWEDNISLDEWNKKRLEALPDTKDIVLWRSTDIVNTRTREREQGHQEALAEDPEFKEFDKMLEEMDRLMADKRERFPQFEAASSLRGSSSKAPVPVASSGRVSQKHVNAKAGPSHKRPVSPTPGLDTASPSRPRLGSVHTSHGSPPHVPCALSPNMSAHSSPPPNPPLPRKIKKLGGGSRTPTNVNACPSHIRVDAVAGPSRLPSSYSGNSKVGPSHVRRVISAYSSLTEVGVDAPASCPHPAPLRTPSPPSMYAPSLVVPPSIPSSSTSSPKVPLPRREIKSVASSARLNAEAGPSRTQVNADVGSPCRPSRVSASRSRTETGADAASTSRPPVGPVNIVPHPRPPPPPLPRVSHTISDSSSESSIEFLETTASSTNTPSTNTTVTVPHLCSKKRKATAEVRMDDTVKQRGAPTPRLSANVPMPVGRQVTNSNTDTPHSLLRSSSSASTLVPLPSRDHPTPSARAVQMHDTLKLLVNMNRTPLTPSSLSPPPARRSLKRKAEDPKVDESGRLRGGCCCRSGESCVVCKHRVPKRPCKEGDSTGAMRDQSGQPPPAPLPGRAGKGKESEHSKTLRLRTETAWSEAAATAGAPGIRFVNDVDDEEVPSAIREGFHYLEDEYWPSDGLPYKRNTATPFTPPWAFTACDCKSESECLDAARCCQDGVDYAYTNDLFNFTYGPSEVVVECNPYCNCSKECPNRVAQRPRTVPIEVFKTIRCGWGVRAPVDVERGRVLGVYTGKLIRRAEAELLTGDAKEYCFDLDYDEAPDEETPEEAYSVDSLMFGNWTKFLNHSCDPNTRVQPVVHDTVEMQRMAFLAIIATKHIPAGTECTFNYNPSHGQQEAEVAAPQRKRAQAKAKGKTSPPPNSIKCFCDTAKCRGWFRDA